MLFTCEGNMDSPARPEKIELVSDGTSNTPTVNVIRIMTACTPYRSCSSSLIPGGSVWRYRLRNFSKMKMNAFAMTNMKEYWTNALSQFQNSHSSVGTMKNGTNKGPTSPHTALAIMLNETTNRRANCASPITINIVQ